MAPGRGIRELSMVDARRELTRLPEELAAEPATITVTRRGKPVLAILTWEDYEALTETIEILSDEDTLQQLRQGLQDVKSGNTLSWSEAKARL
jgi:prevent-host-death family protein